MGERCHTIGEFSTSCPGVYWCFSCSLVAVRSSMYATLQVKGPSLVPNLSTVSFDMIQKEAFKLGSYAGPVEGLCSLASISAQTPMLFLV